MPVVPVMLVPVVLAPLRLASQLAIHVGRDQRFDWLIGKSGHDVDAMLCKDGKGALADAANDDHFDAQALQPARKYSRLVLGRGQCFGAQDSFGVRVHLDHCELAAAAEMRVQAAVLNGECNFHSSVVCFVGFH